jgi:RNA polymerase sigma factor (sigma-70 family)
VPEEDDLARRLGDLRDALIAAIPADGTPDELGAAAIVAQRPTGKVPAPVSWRELEGYDRHAQCLIAARQGDRAALDALVDELTPLVWNVARGNGLDVPAAEDVVQNVWLALLRHLHRLAEPRALVGWLVVTARRESHRSWRDARGTAPLLDDTAEQLPSEMWLPEVETLRDDRDRRLWRAYGRLPRRCQELLRLTVLAGRAEYQAVAEALAMPRGSIGPTRGRCLSTLRVELEREGGV